MILFYLLFGEVTGVRERGGVGCYGFKPPITINTAKSVEKGRYKIEIRGRESSSIFSLPYLPLPNRQILTLIAHLQVKDVQIVVHTAAVVLPSKNIKAAADEGRLA